MRLQKQAACPEGKPVIGLLGIPVSEAHQGEESVDQEDQEKIVPISGVHMVALSARILSDAPE